MNGNEKMDNYELLFVIWNNSSDTIQFKCGTDFTFAMSQDGTQVWFVTNDIRFRIKYQDDDINLLILTDIAMANDLNPKGCEHVSNDPGNPYDFEVRSGYGFGFAAMKGGKRQLEISLSSTVTSSTKTLQFGTNRFVVNQNSYTTISDSVIHVGGYKMFLTNFGVKEDYSGLEETSPEYSGTSPGMCTADDYPGASALQIAGRWNISDSVIHSGADRKCVSDLNLKGNQILTNYSIQNSKIFCGASISGGGQMTISTDIENSILSAGAAGTSSGQNEISGGSGTIEIGSGNVSNSQIFCGGGSGSSSSGGDGTFTSSGTVENSFIFCGGGGSSGVFGGNGIIDNSGQISNSWIFCGGGAGGSPDHYVCTGGDGYLTNSKTIDNSYIFCGGGASGGGILNEQLVGGYGILINNSKILNSNIFCGGGGSNSTNGPGNGELTVNSGSEIKSLKFQFGVTSSKIGTEKVELSAILSDCSVFCGPNGVAPNGVDYPGSRYGINNGGDWSQSSYYYGGRIFGIGGKEQYSSGTIFGAFGAITNEKVGYLGQQISKWIPEKYFIGAADSKISSSRFDRYDSGYQSSSETFKISAEEVNKICLFNSFFSNSVISSLQLCTKSTKDLVLSYYTLPPVNVLLCNSEFLKIANYKFLSDGTEITSSSEASAEAIFNFINLYQLEVLKNFTIQFISSSVSESSDEEREETDLFIRFSADCLMTFGSVTFEKGCEIFIGSARNGGILKIIGSNDFQTIFRNSIKFPPVSVSFNHCILDGSDMSNLSSQSQSISDCTIKELNLDSNHSVEIEKSQNRNNSRTFSIISGSSSDASGSSSDASGSSSNGTTTGKLRILPNLEDVEFKVTFSEDLNIGRFIPMTTTREIPVSPRMVGIVAFPKFPRGTSSDASSSASNKFVISEANQSRSLSIPSENSKEDFQFSDEETEIVPVQSEFEVPSEEKAFQDFDDDDSIFVLSANSEKNISLNLENETGQVHSEDFPNGFETEIGTNLFRDTEQIHLECANVKTYVDDSNNIVQMEIHGETEKASESPSWTSVQNGTFFNSSIDISKGVILELPNGDKIETLKINSISNDVLSGTISIDDDMNLKNASGTVSEQTSKTFSNGTISNESELISEQAQRQLTEREIEESSILLPKYLQIGEFQTVSENVVLESQASIKFTAETTLKDNSIGNDVSLEIGKSIEGLNLQNDKIEFQKTISDPISLKTTDSKISLDSLTTDVSENAVSIKIDEKSKIITNSLELSTNIDLQNNSIKVDKETTFTNSNLVLNDITFVNESNKEIKITNTAEISSATSVSVQIEDDTTYSTKFIFYNGTVIDFNEETESYQMPKDLTMTECSCQMNGYDFICEGSVSFSKDCSFKINGPISIPKETKLTFTNDSVEIFGSPIFFGTNDLIFNSSVLKFSSGTSTEGTEGSVSESSVLKSSGVSTETIQTVSEELIKRDSTENEPSFINSSLTFDSFENTGTICQFINSSGKIGKFVNSGIFSLINSEISEEFNIVSERLTEIYNSIINSKGLLTISRCFVCSDSLKETLILNSKDQYIYSLNVSSEGSFILGDSAEINFNGSIAINRLFRFNSKLVFSGTSGNASFIINTEKYKDNPLVGTFNFISSVESSKNLLVKSLGTRSKGKNQQKLKRSIEKLELKINPTGFLDLQSDSIFNLSENASVSVNGTIKVAAKNQSFNFTNETKINGMLKIYWPVSFLGIFTLCNSGSVSIGTPSSSSKGFQKLKSSGTETKNLLNKSKLKLNWFNVSRLKETETDETERLEQRETEKSVIFGTDSETYISNSITITNEFQNNGSLIVNGQTFLYGRFFNDGSVQIKKGNAFTLFHDFSVSEGSKYIGNGDFSDSIGENIENQFVLEKSVECFINGSVTLSGTESDPGKIILKSENESETKTISFNNNISVQKKYEKELKNSKTTINSDFDLRKLE